MRALLPLVWFVSLLALYLGTRGLLLRYCYCYGLGQQGPDPWALELADVFMQHGATKEGVRELLFVLDLTEIQTNPVAGEPAGSRTRLPFAGIRAQLEERLVYLDL